MEMKKIVDLMNTGMVFTGINTVARHKIYIYQTDWTLDTAFIDFRFKEDKPYYETMLFDPKSGKELVNRKSYSREEALKVHNEVLNEYREMIWKGVQSSIARGYVSDKERYLSSVIKNVWKPTV